MRLLCISDLALQLLGCHCTDFITKLMELFVFRDYLDREKRCLFDLYR